MAGVAIVAIAAWVVISLVNGGGDNGSDPGPPTVATEAGDSGVTTPGTATTDLPGGAAPSEPGGAAAAQGAVETSPTGSSPGETPNGGPPKDGAADGQAPTGAGGGASVGNIPPGSGSAADRRAVAGVIRTYLLSIASGDGATACAQLTEEGRRTKLRAISRIALGIEGTPCSSAILIYQGAYGSAINDPVIRQVGVKGSRARAVGPAGEVATLEQHGGTWLIARYGH